MENNSELIKQLYMMMYSFMINKDKDGLENILDDSFTLTHMTGMIQNKENFVNYVSRRILNYYSAKHDNIYVKINNNLARVTGKSKVSAAVFGGSVHTWSLQQDLELLKKENKWKIVKSIVSTY